MIKPAPGSDVVEMDAMDVAEWEHGQHTPLASSAKLAALVKETARPPEPPPVVRKSSSAVVARAQTADTGLARATPMSIPSVKAPVALPAPKPPARASQTAPRSVATAAHTPRPERVVSRPMPVMAAPVPAPVMAAPAPAIVETVAPLPSPVIVAPVVSSPARVEVTLPVMPLPPPMAPMAMAPMAMAPMPMPPMPIAPAMAPEPVALSSWPEPEPATAPLHRAPDYGEHTRQTDSLPAIPGRSRRGLVIVASAAGAIAIAVIAIVALSGPGEARGSAPVAAITPPAAVDPSKSAAPAATAATEPATPTAPTATVAAISTGIAAPAAEIASPIHAPAKHASRPGRAGKKLVLDYDHPSEQAKPASASDDASLAKARGAYAAGNQHLFAGETDAAISAYRQALADYPGYVAGYRGLGLAFAQQGDKLKAVQALRTYVNAVPNAKDAALIKKRITRLSAR